MRLCPIPGSVFPGNDSVWTARTHCRKRMRASALVTDKGPAGLGRRDHTRWHMTIAQLRLGVNVDHVATVRNARGGTLPDPVRAALLAVAGGADGVTAHLREDRRHITDDDLARLKASLQRPLNLEMAATAEMLEIVLLTKPHAAC